MRIVVLAGGISTERDVSLMSGSRIYKALKENGHEAILLDVFLGYDGDPDHIFDLNVDWAEKVAPVREEEPDISEVIKSRKDQSNMLFGPNVIRICKDADIVFMALHGDCGENGKIQATFDLFDIKYTGTDSLSSALAMDKFLTKQMFRTHGVKTPDSYLLKGPDDPREPEFPCVVKICSGGSSIGVYITKNKEEYADAVQKAFRYEGKVLVEQYIEGRELTDCVIEGKALPIVEIVPLTGFYDYKNKYQAGSTTEICPAQIGDEATKKIQELAVKAYHALGIQTYARMDFIMTEEGEVFCLEANTLPGMTPVSLVPQEAAAIGKSFNDLCEWILEISLKKYE
ncbi:MAG: D-alanine--D-alanine ligase [Lachnospiraceae bacterium]|nr:D-alanine--D-alanine ligase [Lachnospiraceae bacterium]